MLKKLAIVIASLILTAPVCKAIITVDNVSYKLFVWAKNMMNPYPIIAQSWSAVVGIDSTATKVTIPWEVKWTYQHHGPYGPRDYNFWLDAGVGIDTLGALPKLEELTLIDYGTPKSVKRQYDDVFEIYPHTGEEVFGGMTALRKLNAPVFYAHYFYGCPSIEEVYVRDHWDKKHSYNKTMSYEDAIGRINEKGMPKLRKFDIDSLTTGYKSVDGVLYDKAGKVMVAYPNAKGTSYAVADGTESIYAFAFYNCDVEAVELPSTVKKVCKSAFSRSKIRNISLPRGTEAVEDSVFLGCENLEWVAVEATEPPSTYDTNARAEFADVFSAEAYEKCTLKVPRGYREKYAEAPTWKRFKNIEEVDFLSVEGIEAEPENAAAEYYTLTGIRVEQPVSGQMYICRRGKKVEKVFYRD